MKITSRFLKIFIIISLLIIIFQTLYTNNNNNKTLFRYFKWTLQEVSIGKLISISFFSGLFISTILNITTTNYKKNSEEDEEENYKPLNNEGDIKSKVDMPPQRDIRDAQPTISVNYRVVKNTEENNLKRDQNYSNIPDNEDDWNNDDNDW